MDNEQYNIQRMLYRASIQCRIPVALQLNVVLTDGTVGRVLSELVHSSAVHLPIVAGALRTPLSSKLVVEGAFPR